jgi:hypothetical protein
MYFTLYDTKGGFGWKNGNVRSVTGSMILKQAILTEA